MNREHGTRSKARGNENPFNAGGINKKTSAKGKPVPIPKLNPVQQANFYGTTSRSIHPAGAPSPANSSAQRSGNNKGKQREVIPVDDGDSDVESIEDANDIQAAPPQSAQRPSMSRGKVNRQDNAEDEPVHLKTQISTGSGANATAKPRKTGGKGGVVSRLFPGMVIWSSITNFSCLPETWTQCSQWRKIPARHQHVAGRR